jgi:hypothetical protein
MKIFPKTLALLTTGVMVGHQLEVLSVPIGSPYHVEVSSFVRRSETTRRVNVDSGSDGTMYTGITSLVKINWVGI